MDDSVAEAHPAFSLLVSDKALHVALQSVVAALDERARHFSNIEDLLADDDQETRYGDSTWLIEAQLLSEEQGVKHSPPALDHASEIILLGDASQRERLSNWLSGGRAVYLHTPLDEDYLKNLLRDILSERARAGDRPGKHAALDQYGLLYGSSNVMRELYRHLRKAAQTDATLLICGESGTGKELIARSVHSYSSRSEAGFETINCGAIPADLLESELFGHEKGSFTGAERMHRGLFERAGEGTLFLDEITEMPLPAQAKLLHVLEAGTFRRVGGQEEMRCHARVITASNRDPQQAIDDNELRLDLYYRICQMEVLAPPLRERDDDVVHLARLFARQYSRHTGLAVRLSPDAEQALRRRQWPGNVRELRHCILSAARLCRGRIGPDDLDGPGIAETADLEQAPGAQTPALCAGMRIDDMERQLIELTLAETGGNKTHAADMLGISVRTLYNRLAKYEETQAS